MENGVSRRTLLAASAGAGLPLGPFRPEASGHELPAATDEITPFRLRVPDRALSDLNHRLAATRWPERETVGDGSQGPQLARMQRLVHHWRTRYDWRRVESRLNAFGQFRTRIDGLGIHFLHVRSRHRAALPLVLTHGWPGSVVEFLDVIGPLTDPTAFGGRPEDAFHVVVPSLPGFGFSDKPDSTGWNIQRTARAWTHLMTRLGYDRYIAQGGDWGSAVSAEMARLKPPGLVAIHLNLFLVFEPPIVGEPTPEEKEALAKLERFNTDGFGYFAEQSTRPQQVGYGLTDSPVGQAAWIYEKFLEWTDPASSLTDDQVLDDVMLYWLPATAASSARLYWEFGREQAPGAIDLPVGFSAFPGEIVPLPRVWAERIFQSNLVYFNEVARGGHFAAFEQPRLFAEELRTFARLVR